MYQHFPYVSCTDILSNARQWPCRYVAAKNDNCWNTGERQRWHYADHLWMLTCGSYNSKLNSKVSDFDFEFSVVPVRRTWKNETGELWTSSHENLAGTTELMPSCEMLPMKEITVWFEVMRERRLKHVWSNSRAMKTIPLLILTLNQPVIGTVIAGEINSPY